MWAFQSPQEADAKTRLNVQKLFLGKCLWVNTGRKWRNLRSSWIMMQAWQREGGTSGWKLWTSVQSQEGWSKHKSQWGRARLCRVLSLLRMDLPLSSTFSHWLDMAYEKCDLAQMQPWITEHSSWISEQGWTLLWEVTRHRLRAATCRSPLDPELNRSEDSPGVAYTWVVPWIHMELVPWRKKWEEPNLGRHWGMRCTGGSGCPINRWLENMKVKEVRMNRNAANRARH